MFQQINMLTLKTKSNDVIHFALEYILKYILYIQKSFIKYIFYFIFKYKITINEI